MVGQAETHYCARCGALLNEQAFEIGHCTRCGKRLPKELRNRASQSPAAGTEAAIPSPPPAATAAATALPTEVRSIPPYKFHTDGAGVFNIYADDERNYEFLKGAGCDEAHITPAMVTLVRRDLDVQGKVVSSTSFFEAFSNVLEYYKDRLEVA